MPKMLLVTVEYPPNSGGVGWYYKSLVEELPRGSVAVLTSAINGLRIADCGLKESDRVKVIRRAFFWCSWPRWGKLVLELVRLLRREHYDWIAVGQVLPVGTAALFARWILHTFYQLSSKGGSSFGGPMTNDRLLIFAHGMDVTTLRGRKCRFARFILRRADIVIANSQHTQRALFALGIAPEKVHVLTPCPALAYGRVQPRTLNYEPRTSPLILSVGRLVRRKGFDTALKVFARVRETLPTVGLAIIGDGLDRTRLERIALELGFDPQTIFKGALEPKGIVPWYARASVFLLLPRDEGNGDVEGFGMAFLEANLFGLPVVAGRSGGVEEAVVDEETGFLVDPADVDAAAARVTELLNDEGLRQRLGQLGRERVLRDFRWEDRSRTLTQLLASR